MWRMPRGFVIAAGYLHSSLARFGRPPKQQPAEACKPAAGMDPWACGAQLRNLSSSALSLFPSHSPYAAPGLAAAESLVLDHVGRIALIRRTSRPDGSGPHA
ncbi:hypothetical protein XA68_16209 [Ophiocordyceps unilateralis]|uniref:Uncharacterized protein n=1 Tax=Ophiocordyceps unilateralis TaxID=268505 RepID=A0A2A9P5B8_OPHUN|nr:hypothetical protein XA68_16209 [Ophiocordyceps unilateralis]